MSWLTKDEMVEEVIKRLLYHERYEVLRSQLVRAEVQTYSNRELRKILEETTP